MEARVERLDLLLLALDLLLELGPEDVSLLVNGLGILVPGGIILQQEDAPLFPTFPNPEITDLQGIYLGINRKTLRC